MAIMPIFTPKRTVIGFLTMAAVAIALWLAASRNLVPDEPGERVYVAVEGDGVVAVIDPSAAKVIRKIDLAIPHEGGTLRFAPHNIQASPDGASIWVTANAGRHDEHAASLLPRARAHGGAEETAEPDEIVVIDPARDRIIKRIGIAPDAHLAHVVFSPDGKTAWVTAQARDIIYRINANTYAIEARIAAPAKSEPHGIRMAPDGARAYVALLAGKALGIVDVRENSLASIPLGGQAVQTGVTPDGRFVAVSLYDARSLILYGTADGSVRRVALPANARGPIQMYPAPDSRHFYLADQGYYFGQPTGNRIYKIDVAAGATVGEIPAGGGPHGVVVSPDGARVFVTNLRSADVSVIDARTDREAIRIPVGKEPNGITWWSRDIVQP